MSITVVAMPAKTRRTFLQLSALSFAAAPAFTALRSATTTGTPSSSAGGKFGPTAGHWPTRTPVLTGSFNRTIEVNASWTEIAKAIKTASTYPYERTRILVRPGTLNGYGSDSSSTPVLANVGALGRSSRILITPRDGVRSVSFSNSIRLVNVRGVTFAGFWLWPHGINLSAVQDLAWGFSKGASFTITGTGGVTQNIELVECVSPNGGLRNYDSWAFRSYRNELAGVSVVGCYIAPSYKQAGSSEHVDTLQLSGPLPQRNITITDSVIFASTNAAVIAASNSRNVALNHSLVIGGDRTLVRYPLPRGADAFTSGPPISVNGDGTSGVLSSRNSILIGPLHGAWATVSNAVISGKVAATASSGAFTVDSSLKSMSAAWLDARSSNPTDAYLQKIWTP